MSDFRQRIEKLSPKRLALLALELQSKLEEKERERTDPIAIIGIGCRMPGSGVGPQAFWKFLEESRDAITETPIERWDVSEYYDPDPDAPGRMSTKLGSYLSNVDLFDAPFFSIARREAVSMDPQQRVLLEVCWEALENAGHSPRKLSGTATGVFLGICSTDYHDLLLARGDEAIDAYVASGVAPSIAAGRISYTLGLQGPSMAVDTACSASLVAVHLACQSLRTLESRTALAGGVNIMLAPETTIALSKAHMMAPDGRCKTFDSRADGFVRGEGCGIVVLKRLSDALADSDNILAVIRASAVNQDGRSSGITAPNGAAQESLIRQALASGGVKPEEISLVEAHGTGTSLGDPIEAHALAAVLGPNRSKENPLIVGSVKTNVGHLESAAGVTGLIKLVLSLQHETIPANLHFQKMNPHIDWNGVPVEIPVASRPWTRGGKKRLAALSSFGFSGTNAHVIVEEAPARRERKKEFERPLHILALSGRNQAALRELSGRYEEELANTAIEPGDICYTANAGRAHFEQRMFVVGATVEDIRRKLQERKTGTEAQERGGVRPVFLFSGQGAQYAGMGQQLYETQPVFRKAIDECEELLKAELEKPLGEVMWGAATDVLEQTAYTQPALFALEYAMSEMWKSWGIVPGVVLGHSVGEYVAACVAGVYGLADGLKLIAARARLMQKVSGRGAMAAVMAKEERVREALKGLEARVSVAGLNAPESVVISGYEEEVGIAETKLRDAGVRVQRLAVSHGFHSPQMAEMEVEFEAIANEIKYAAPRVKLISSVTGKEGGREEISGSYWRWQVREPVRYQKAMETLRDLGQRVFVEVGPGSTLIGLGKQCIEAQEETGKTERLWAVSIRKNKQEWEQVLESLGKLYERGAEVDWEGFDQGYARRRVELPTYPFQRQRYWIENPVRRNARMSSRTDVETVPDDWYYQLNWEPKPHVAVHAVSGEAKTAARWLVVSENKDIAERLCARMEAAGGTANVAYSREVTIEQLRNRTYDSVVHVCAQNDSDSEILSREMQSDGRRSLMSSALATAQAILSEKSKAKLWLITSDAQSVMDTQTALNIAQAQVWGFGRTFALEHPGLWGGLIDLDPSDERGESIPEIVSSILRPDAEDQLAFRNGKRYGLRLTRRAPLSNSEKPHFLPNKNYVITGGLGSLGLHVAEWMVERGARNLVLMARRAPSAEGQKVIDALKVRGARVEVRAADVASKFSVQTTFQDIIRTMGSIDGVVHAAGYIDDGLLEQQTWERMEKVLAPKVAGAWNLHEATAGMRLEFFILFSAFAALTGSAGTSGYAAGNAFMDALAQHRRSLGLPALSINWGAWEGEGMGKHVGGAKGSRAGITFMPPRLALAALGSALSISDPQIAIGALDWNFLKPTFEGSAKRPLLEHLFTEISGVAEPPAATPTAAKSRLQELHNTSPEERTKNLIEYLITAVAPILALEPHAIEPSRPLTDFGVDSLMALEFKNRLNFDLGITIPTVRFLEGITLQEVAAQIVKELPASSIPNSSSSDSTLSSQPSASSAVTPLDEVLRVASAKRPSWLEDYLVPALAAILGVETSSVNSMRSISDYGLDSLMALEFKNKIAADLSVTIPTVRFLEGPSLREIAAQIGSELPKASVISATPELLEATIEYPLSFAQQQAYFGHKLMPDSAAFNVGFTAKASPRLDWPIFQRSVAKLLKRHPALRAVIVETDLGPVQRILPPDTQVASLIDASSMQESELKEQVTRDFQKNFELDQPLFRVNVFRLADCDIMSFKVDHIIIDHWSVQLCVEDLKKIYSAELAGKEAVLPPVKGEYQDFVSWEAQLSQNAELWGYWKEKLGGVLPQLDIPSPRHRPKALLARGEAIPLLLPRALSAQIKQVARPLKATSYTFMLAAFQLLLRQFSHQDDVIVGTSVTGREDARWTNTIGFFVNVLPLRAKFSTQQTFADHLMRSRETVLGALQHQEFPFAAMITRLGLGRSLDRIPVFQAFFNFLTDHAGEFGRLFMGAEGAPVPFGNSELFPWLTLPLQEGRVEVGVQLVEVQGHVDGYLNYNSDVMDRLTAEAMAVAYGKILEAVVRDPNTPIESLAQDSEELGSEREEFAL